MRFLETLMFLVVLICMESAVACGFQSYIKLCNQVESRRNELDSIRFISETFRNTCRGNGKGFSDLVEWQKTCKALWQLDYIGWSQADAFMELEDTKSDILLFGTWSGAVGKGEVYCRKSAY